MLCNNNCILQIGTITFHVILTIIFIGSCSNFEHFSLFAHKFLFLKSVFKLGRKNMTYFETSKYEQDPLNIKML